MPNPFRDPEQRLVMAGKRRVASVLCSNALGRVIRGVSGGNVPASGLRIDVQSPAVPASEVGSLFFGLYEGAERRLLRHLGQSPTLVELGTSLGFITSQAAAILGRPLQIVGVEANPRLLRLAQNNIGTNAPDVDLRLIHGAIDYQSSQGTQVSFVTDGSHTGARLAAEPGSGSSFTAPSVTLSQVLTDCNVDEFTLIADIEGAEAGILIDDPESLSLCTQGLIELHNTTYRGRAFAASDLRAILLGLGFEVRASYGNVVVFDRSARRVP